MAQGVGAPIFHVNGDDVDAVVAVCRLAAEWRQTFRRDCVVDIVCYRRHGHNSQDDPSITQPQTYRRIRTHPTTLDIYERQLLAAGVQVRAGFHCAALVHDHLGTRAGGTVRASFGPFNTAADVEALCTAVAEIAG